MISSSPHIYTADGREHSYYTCDHNIIILLSYRVSHLALGGGGEYDLGLPDSMSNSLLIQTPHHEFGLYNQMYV